jgi:glutaredoxin-like protein NrdH
VRRRKMDIVKVLGGNNKHKVLLYALSTCIWCRRTKQFLKDNDIEYEYVDVDLASKEDKDEIRKNIQNRGGSLAFPITIIDDKKLINGYRVDDLREALEI